MTSPSPRGVREVLEDALAADFDDFATHAAYADLLMEQGDPRGEYLRMQLALEDTERPRRELQEHRERCAALLLAHEREWLGDLAPLLLAPRGRVPVGSEPNCQITYRRGWLATVDVFGVRDSLTKALATAPQARMLQSLTLRQAVRPNGSPLEPLREACFLPGLRRFQLGDDDPNQWISTADGDEVVELVQRMPRLEELILRAEGVDAEALFGLPMPHLRLLQVDFADRHPLKRLAENASLANLTHLYLDPRPQYRRRQPEPDAPATGAVLTRDEIRAVVNSPHLQKLTHLRLRLTGFGDAGCDEIARSGILRRLRVLDLREADVSDEGARALASSPDLGHLELLDVGMNRLTLAGVTELRAAEIRRLQYDGQIGAYGFDEWGDLNGVDGAEEEPYGA